MPAWVQAEASAGKAEEEAADLAAAEVVAREEAVAREPEVAAVQELEVGLELAAAAEVKDNEDLHSHHG
jgi:hypothetical protein